MTDLHALAKLARLMSSEPADILHPRRLVKSQAVLAGKLPISKLERLIEVVHSTEGDADYKLEFVLDDVGNPCVDVRLTAELALSCQRCLQPLSMTISSDNRLQIIDSDEQVADLPANHEPLVLSEDRLSLSDFIEDGILLALPIAPLHAIDKCPAATDLSKATTEKHNPFAEIKRLQMKNRSK